MTFVRLLICPGQKLDALNYRPNVRIVVDVPAVVSMAWAATPSLLVYICNKVVKRNWRIQARGVFRRGANDDGPQRRQPGKSRSRFSNVTPTVQHLGNSLCSQVCAANFILRGLLQWNDFYRYIAVTHGVVPVVVVEIFHQVRVLVKRLRQPHTFSFTAACFEKQSSLGVGPNFGELDVVSFFFTTAALEFSYETGSCRSCDCLGFSIASYNELCARLRVAVVQWHETIWLKVDQ